MTLPADGHVHSEWSWDTRRGAMEASCARAVELGLPAIAFTEHLDHTVWRVATSGAYADELSMSLASPDGLLTPPAFDAEGYLAELSRCRSLFPSLRVMSGVEMGEPHWHAEACASVLAANTFDRVLGSLHCLPVDDGYAEVWGVYLVREPATVMREYLAEVAKLVAGTDSFAVLTHIDYAVRYWPLASFDPLAFEDEFRHALRATASSGKALEINTRLPLDATILRWWHEEGGDAVAFGSDAHEPATVARGFKEAADMASAHGFKPGRNPYDLWPRED